MNFRKNSKGITLIALVVSIMIMTILLGVSINAITGSDGLLMKSQYAHFCHEFEKVNEAMQIYVGNNRVEKYGCTKVDSMYQVATVDEPASEGNGEEVVQDAGESDGTTIVETEDGGYDVTELLTIYPVEGDQISINDCKDTLKQTIRDIEELEEEDLVDLSKVDLYLVDTGILGQKTKYYYLVNIISGEMYSVDGFVYRKNTYHVPGHPVNLTPDDDDEIVYVEDDDGVKTEKELTIHYLYSNDGPEYTQKVAYSKNSSAKLDAVQFTKDNYAFVYWKDISSERSEPVKEKFVNEVSDFQFLTGKYYDTTNQLCDDDGLGMRWQEDILDYIEEIPDYVKDPDDEDEAPDGRTNAYNQILEYLKDANENSYNYLEETFSSGENYEGYANWLIDHADYLTGLMNYEEENYYEDESDKDVNEEAEKTYDIYYDQDVVNMLGQDMYLEAVWAANPVKLNANGGSVNGVSVSELGVVLGEEYGPKLVDATKKGYFFRGWYTQATGGNQIVADDLYNPDDLYDNTLYAQWSIDPVIIKCYGNGGMITKDNGKTVSVLDVKRARGVMIGNLPTPTIEMRYNFVGWYTEPIGGEIVTSSTLASDMQIYAHYVESLVALDAQGGEYWNNAKNDKHLLYFKNWNPVKYGGIFVQTDRKIGIQSQKGGFGYQLPVSSRWYYVWSKTYWGSRENTTIYYGVSRGIRIQKTIVGYDGKNHIIKDKFNGWFTQKNGQGEKVKPTSKWKESYGNTLYASWTKSCVITYDGNGGTWSKGRYTQKQKYNVYVGKRFTNCSAPSRVGYKFKGWFDAPEGGNKVVANKDYKPTVTGDTTLYAHWEIKPFKINVSNITQTGFDITPVGTGTKAINSGATIRYYINTSPSGTLYQESAVVNNLSDYTTRYVWAVIVDDEGHSTRSKNYRIVTTAHVHVGSCYRWMTNYYYYAGIKFDSSKGYKNQLGCRGCGKSNICDNKYVYALMNKRYVENGYNILVHGENCNSDDGVFCSSGTGSREVTVYWMKCDGCGEYIYDHGISSACGNLRCKHVRQRQVPNCSKQLQNKSYNW